MSPTRARTPLPLLAALCLFPAAASFVAVYLEFYPHAAFPLGKLGLVAIPLLVWRAAGLSRQDVLAAAGVKRTSCLAGLASGAVLAAIILAGYHALLAGAIDPRPVAAKAESLGILEHYWTMGAFVALANSLMEEYYWRAFILERMRRHTRSVAVLCAANGAAFGLHHIFVLAPLFSPGVVALCVFGTMVAGAVWSWQRLRGRSVLDCYVSHVIADLAALWAGADLIGIAP